jgi:hypothetical protein
MEARQRRSFTEEYKRQAAELVVSGGRSITAVGKELGLRDSVLRRWVEKLRRTRLGDRPAAPGERTAAYGNGCAWNCPAPWRACAGVETTLCYPLRLRGKRPSLLEALCVK